ncbi:MAG: hypothetical protein C0469_12390 [Cyanobacteria bacterium DS2.3.42]|nr:hypothetical protein [Cyanobacteria bacterium DS2.3.42]
MAAPAGDAAIVGNTVVDALALNNQADSANHLATEAVNLFGSQDFSGNREFKDAALLDLVNRELLPALTWAEAQSLDRNGDQIIQMGEGNELMASGDLFQQLAAEFMSRATRDVTLEELAALSAQTSKAQDVPSEAPLLNTENPDYMQFSGATDATTLTYEDGERPAFAPETEVANPDYMQFSGSSDEHNERPAYAPEMDESSSLGALKSKNSSVTDRLKAIKSLVADGQTTASITDSNGNQLGVRMEVIPVAGSERSMVHMFAVDPSTGKEFVILRAISDGDSFTQQKDASGQDVDFVGTRWRNNHPDSMFCAS